MQILSTTERYVGHVAIVSSLTTIAATIAKEILSQAVMTGYVNTTWKACWSQRIINLTWIQSLVSDVITKIQQDPKYQRVFSDQVTSDFMMQKLREILGREAYLLPENQAVYDQYVNEIRSISSLEALTQYSPTLKAFNDSMEQAFYALFDTLQSYFENQNDRYRLFSFMELLAAKRYSLEVCEDPSLGYLNDFLSIMTTITAISLIGWLLLVAKDWKDSAKRGVNKSFTQFVVNNVRPGKQEVAKITDEQRQRVVLQIQALNEDARERDLQTRLTEAEKQKLLKEQEQKAWQDDYERKVKVEQELIRQKVANGENLDFGKKK